MREDNDREDKKSKTRVLLLWCGLMVVIAIAAMVDAALTP